MLPWPVELAIGSTGDVTLRYADPVRKSIGARFFRLGQTWDGGGKRGPCVKLTDQAATCGLHYCTQPIPYESQALDSWSV